MPGYTVRKITGKVADSHFGRFGWEVVRPDGSQAVLTNSKQSAAESAAKLNKDGHL